MALPNPPPSASYPDSATRRAEQELIDAFHRCRTDKAEFARRFFKIEPTAFQQEVLSGSGRVDTTVAGRRTGKSTAKVIDAVHDLAVRGFNRRAFVGAPSLDQAEQYVREIREAAERAPLMRALIKGGPERGIHKSSGFPVVEFVTGGELHCRATVQEGRYLRGKGADAVYLSEAAFISDEVYDRAVRALVLDRRGRIHLDSSPNGDNFVKRLFDRATQPRGHYSKESANGYYTNAHGTVYDNPLLSREDIEAIRSELPEYAWRTEYLAEFIESGDAVFSWELLVRLFDHDYGQLSKAFDATKRYVIGVDLAQVSDYTAIVVIDRTGRPPYRLAHWRRFRGVPYMGPGGVVDQVSQLQRDFSGARVYVDATSEKAVAESLPNAEPVVFTGPLRAAMMSHLIVLAENEQLALPARFRALRDEMRALRRARLPGGGVRADHPRDGYDDCVWALALACRGLQPAKAQAPPAVIEALQHIRWYAPAT